MGVSGVKINVAGRPVWLIIHNLVEQLRIDIKFSFI
jgi:hypothetical protein|tara:strand:+ start:1652 stop:1759 length:108 start_codon:yes stop_codon:yes gene_type:complete